MDWPSKNIEKKIKDKSNYIN